MACVKPIHIYYFIYKVGCKQFTIESHNDHNMVRLEQQVNEAIRVVESEAEAREVPSIDV